MKLKLKRLAIVSIIFLAITILHYLKVTQPLELLLIRGLSPLKKLSVNFSNFIFNTQETISSIKDLRQLNLDLKTENQKLRLELNNLKEAAVDNEYLRQQLNFTKTSGLATKEAKVLSYNLDNIGHSFLINLGQADGLAVGQAVVDSQGFLVGIVETVSSKSARVLLITDQASLVSVRLQDSRADGLIKGDYGLEVILFQVPDTETIKAGDRIITAGLSAEVPGGILIGEIEGVWQQPGDLFQSAKVKTYANFSRLEKVFITVK